MSQKLVMVSFRRIDRSMMRIMVEWVLISRWEVVASDSHFDEGDLSLAGRVFGGLLLL